jgi:hypothetical protein
MSPCASFTKVGAQNKLPASPVVHSTKYQMRWFEIVEASTPAERMQKQSERARKARDKIADAQRKRSEASRRYQDQRQKAGDSPSKASEAGQRYQDSLRSANAAQRAAQAKLSSP